MALRFSLIAVVVLTVTSCSKAKPRDAQSTPAEKKITATEPARPVPDACTLLTSDEIKSVLGEPVQQTKPSSQADAGMTMSQCYFALPTAANSAVLTVIRKGGGNATREWWDETFHREHDDEEKGEREEGEKKVKPEKVDSLGDEAYWCATKIGGALYVLKGDTSIRISVGEGAASSSAF